MNRNDFNYNLPEELIAQHPLEPRDSSRLLVCDRASGNILHKHFYNLPEFLRSGDVLVINNTRVLPARLYGIKNETGAKVEVLLLKRKDYTDWEVLLKPAKRLKIGSIVTFSNRLSAEIIEKFDGGNAHLRFIFSGIFEEILYEVGQMPLPHYIKEKLIDKERYQTVYSKENGSSAAPTAGLHFTPQLLERIREKGVEIVEVLLHVGLGTFRPVSVENILDHKMHSEHFEISEAAASVINAAKFGGRRIVAVGTTSVRVLESGCNEQGVLVAQKSDTDIFIYPGYKFKVVDSLITNFHLPESTLIMLVSALYDHKKVMQLYSTAVEEKYRFFSFGDSMFLI